MIKRLSSKVSDSVCDIAGEILLNKIKISLFEYMELKQDIQQVVFAEWLYKINDPIVAKHSDIFHKSKSMHINTNGMYNVRLDKHTYLFIRMYTRCKQSYTRTNTYEETATEFYIYGSNRRKYMGGFERAIRIKKNMGMKNPIPVYINGDAKMIESKTFDSIVGYDFSKVINRLDSWKNNSRVYTKLELTHKIGILLYGPHGTGKTSVAKAIAHRYDKSIVIADCGKDLEQIKSDIMYRSNCVILFEEIDKAIGAKKDNSISDERDAKEAFIMQVLDGTLSESGCIYIATTNHIELLNEELLRDGRFDIKIFMDNISAADARRMCKINNVPVDIIKDNTIKYNPAQVQNMITEYTLLKTYEDVIE